MKKLRLILPAAMMAAAAGCNFTPKRQAPDMQIPAHFKEDGRWKVAKPAAHVPRGEWWKIFHDSELNTLMRQIEVSNQSLQSSVAKAEQTAALFKSAKWSLLPSAEVSANATRGQTNPANGVHNVKGISGSASWELDVWGRLSHGTRAARADLQAAEGDVESLKLSLQAQLAQTYFSLRSVDSQRGLLEGEVANYEKSLELTRNRLAQGVASSADVAQAQTQLATTRAALIELGVQRGTLEHALATLVGRMPASFGLKGGSLASSVPSVPRAMPSSLLERRPDIAAAERRVAAANERVGAARAAFFPTITLSAANGWSGIAQLLAASSNYWSLGIAASEAILDSGKRIAAKAQADATWRQTVADYRQTVLTAMQEAEDALVTLRVLAQESGAQDEAARAARESERIALNQYKAGTLSYLNVASAQATALAAERGSIDIRVRRLNAAVALIKALGGSW